MNQYPAWKYIFIGLILLAGLLYALPNLFGEDPALQVTSGRGFAIAANLSKVIDDALANEQIDVKDHEQVGNSLLYRFNSTPDQIRASDVVKKAVGDEAVTNGGLLGRITKVGESFVTLELADNVQIKVQRHAISSIMPKGTIKSA